MHSIYCVCVALFLYFVNDASGSRFDLTVSISPREFECFFQTIKKGKEVEIYYEVIEGGDMDVDVQVKGPDGFMYNDGRATENDVNFKSKVDGDFKICFDNSFSSFSSKVVFFEVMIDDGIGERMHDGDDDEGEDDEEKRMNEMTFDGEDIGDQLSITAREFMGIMDRAKGHLEHSVQLQRLKLMGEAKDRHTMVGNLWRVTYFSMFQVVVMIATAVTQVLVIRKLFSNSKPIRCSGGSLRART